jgi:hypothetical protein
MNADLKLPVHLPTIVALLSYCPSWSPSVKTYPMLEVAAIN